ncbi:hypothetical protein CBR_g48821 [Chara braunii]|uniref:Cycloeucalenol cycloisomerase n=1 Tax=Chara braunii TaxID=69332 RepID=A0A388M3F0_CHABU|nr:hypothetical protein CBR_g48821 [Chara braunii]|eukprot:GBG89110.1 hypothetical protein CBR_g48821 [Chara braunii]
MASLRRLFGDGLSDGFGRCCDDTHEGAGSNNGRGTRGNWQQGQVDTNRPLYERHWFKANIWIAIFSFNVNYFFTHYFYTVLGARYTFPSWRLNNVPIPLYFMTHPYFCFYHTISNMLLRRLRHAISTVGSRCTRWVIQALFIIVLSYITAAMEAITIANFPYYDFVDRWMMYTVGSLFYAMYFFISYPMYIRLDEKPNEPWTVWQSVVDSMGVAMIVLIMLDFWRIGVGPIVDIPGVAECGDCVKHHSLPWLSL